MNRRTFEIIAKWIGEESGVKIEFNADVSCPCANPKEKIIRLPDISKENALAGLSHLMHEAGHIKHSARIPEEFMGERTSKEILNVMEDIRIDWKVMNMLPNVRMFYEEGNKKKPPYDKVSKEFKALCNAIYKLEQFGQHCYSDKETKEFLKKIGEQELYNEILEGINGIEYDAWSDVKEAINKVRTRLGMKKDPTMKLIPVAVKVKMQGQGKDKNDGQGEALGIGVGKDGESEGSSQGDKSPLDGIEGIRANGRCWGTGSLPGRSMGQFEGVELEELTKNAFKELLNITEVEKIEDGLALATDNLQAFFTGDIDELFDEEIEIKKKKSKVMFLLDCSGSMGGCFAIDHNTYRFDVVRKAVKSVCHILQEVMATEGINVDYCVRFFDDSYHKPNDWENEYSPRGGTAFYSGFNQAMDELCSDFSIDGKRIIIVFTDGDVYPDDVENAKRLIVQHANDIRMMFIGVDTDLQHKSVELFGDNIIMSGLQSNEILMDAISATLE